MSCLKWAYGVTTVPARRSDLLPRTLTSLEEAGFDKPRLFVDGCGGVETSDYLDRFGLEVTARNPAVRCPGNWILALYELYLRNPWHDRYAIFQDDLLAVKNLRDYLDRSPYPDGKDGRSPGYLNLFTWRSNLLAIPKSPSGTGYQIGWFEGLEFSNGRIYHGKQQQRGRGAVGLVFNNEAVRVLLTAQHMVDRARDPDHWHHKLDGGVVESTNKAGWREYVHNPSLLQHTGNLTTMGNNPHPPSPVFPGEDFDALDLLRAIQPTAPPATQPPTPQPTEGSNA